jgi:hypothetical protein
MAKPFNKTASVLDPGIDGVSRRHVGAGSGFWVGGKQLGRRDRVRLRAHGRDRAVRSRDCRAIMRFYAQAFNESRRRDEIRKRIADGIAVSL